MAGSATPTTRPASAGPPALPRDASWTGYLDALSAAVRHTSEALDDTEPAGTPVDFAAPPAPDEPLDAGSQERTAAVLDELTQLVERLTAAQRGVGTQLAHIRRRTGERSAPTGARYVDGYG